MELRLLTTFLKVAQLQSFSKAAESLGYSQSAVTVQVQQLENELGVRLFDRIGKTVSITHYGQEFIPYARDVVSAAARAVSSSACSISASVTMQLSGRGASFSKSGLLQAMRGAGTPSGLE